jgi:hypothetical protein
LVVQIVSRGLVVSRQSRFGGLPYRLLEVQGNADHLQAAGGNACDCRTARGLTGSVVELTMAKRKQLTEDEWLQVFKARCQTKQGRPISEAEHDLVNAAYKSDRARYSAMEKDVFNATVPFGSNVRMK